NFDEIITTCDIITQSAASDKFNREPADGYQPIRSVLERGAGEELFARGRVVAPYAARREPGRAPSGGGIRRTAFRSIVEGRDPDGGRQGTVRLCPADDEPAPARSQRDS